MGVRGEAVKQRQGVQIVLSRSLDVKKPERSAVIQDGRDVGML